MLSQALLKLTRPRTIGMTLDRRPVLALLLGPSVRNNGLGQSLTQLVRPLTTDDPSYVDVDPILRAFFAFCLLVTRL